MGLNADGYPTVMSTIEANFMHTSSGSEVWPPHIIGQTPIAYVCNGKEGYITFNGTYHVENHPPPYPEDEALPRWERPRRYTDYLPKKHFLFVKIRETEPYRIDVSGNTTYTHYRTLEDSMFMVEIYKKVIHECTDQYGLDDIDGDGELVSVCFTPTNKQTVYFRVLEVIETGAQLKDLIERESN